MTKLLSDRIAAFSAELQKIAAEKTDAELKEIGRQRGVTSLAAEAVREKGRRGERAGEAAGRGVGVAAGALVGSKLLRSVKHGRLPGALAGMAAGYGIGGKAGKELGTELDIRKNAAAELEWERAKTAAVMVKLSAEKEKKPSAAGVMARSLGGMALGTGAGYGAAKGIEYVAEKASGKTRGIGKWWPVAAAGAGAGLGAVYPYLKAREMKELQSAGEHK